MYVQQWLFFRREIINWQGRAPICYSGNGCNKEAKSNNFADLFTSNHCPTSHSIEKRLQKFYDEYKGKGVKLVAINPNHPDGLSKDELGYGEFGDSYAEMKPYAEKNKWTFDYLYDGDTQTVARAYGCLATPHVFVFDKNLKLRYQGRFDDSRFYDDSTVKSKDCQNAVDAILAGKPVELELTKPMGCSTKWREKKALHDVKHETWAKTPVTVELIDKAGIANLRANKSNKYRMINVWATWCPPCVKEFPDLVEISRKFDMRDFELVTITLDDPKDKAKAEAFLFKQAAGMSKKVENSLKKEGRTTNSYLFAGSNDELAAALDVKRVDILTHGEKTPRDSTIREKFNTYRFADYKESMIELLAKVVRVSVDTVAITEAMKAVAR